MENIWYVYVHEVNGICFYVGIGKTEGRWRQRRDRNEYWQRVVAQNGGTFNAHKILLNLTKEEACLKEQRYIELFRLHKAARTNLTDGGEGTVGFRMTAENKARRSAVMRGNKINLGKRHSDYTRAKMSEAQRGHKRSVKGRIPSEESKRKNSETQKGRAPYPNSLAAAQKKRIPVYCPQTDTTYESLGAAAEALNVAVCNIRMVLKGQRKTTGGYTFTLCV
jgi:group I intron endonuclease